MERERDRRSVPWALRQINCPSVTDSTFVQTLLISLIWSARSQNSASISQSRLNPAPWRWLMSNIYSMFHRHRPEIEYRWAIQVSDCLWVNSMTQSFVRKVRYWYHSILCIGRWYINWKGKVTAPPRSLMLKRDKVQRRYPGRQSFWRPQELFQRHHRRPQNWRVSIRSVESSRQA